MIVVAFCLLLFFCCCVLAVWYFGAGCFCGVGLCGTVYLRTRRGSAQHPSLV